MRTFSFIILLFLLVLLFFEVTDWTPSVPTTKEIASEKTVITETRDESGEVTNVTATTSSTQTQEDQ